MQPLTIDDLLPLDEYSRRRREYFESHRRYVDRYRRVRVGPSVTLVFENRQTLWFRIHEIIRIARLAEAGRLSEELRLYNAMLPGHDHLQAALIAETDLADLHSEQVTLTIGRETRPSMLITCRPEDRCAGMAHWVQFEMNAAARQELANLDEPAFLTIDHPNYRHCSPSLSSDVRQSLVDDLNLSDRDAA